MEKKVTEEKSFIRSKQKYGIISQNILRNPFISVPAKALYSYLSGFAGVENTAFPGRDLVCHEMGWNKDTFTKYMWEMQCWDIVSIEQERGKSGQFERNVYVLDHYPDKVMIDRNEFEKTTWPDLKVKIDSKGSKGRKANKSVLSPCPKVSDTVENESPCPKIPDTVQPDPVEPDPVFSDTNNNSLNSNSLNNNIYINNNNAETSIQESGESVVVVIDQALSGEHQETNPVEIPDGSRLKLEIQQIFREKGMSNLPANVANGLQGYSLDEVRKIADILQEKKQKGIVTNPVGMLIAHPEVAESILKGELYTERSKTNKSSKVTGGGTTMNNFEVYGLAHPDFDSIILPLANKSHTNDSTT